MEHINLADQPPREIAPGYRTRYVHTEHVTIQYCTITAGSPMPEHAHPHEQVSTVIRGRFEMVVDGKTMLLEEGSALVIPPHIKHAGTPLTDCYIIDVFHPRREDFIVR